MKNLKNFLKEPYFMILYLLYFLVIVIISTPSIKADADLRNNVFVIEDDEDSSLIASANSAFILTKKFYEKYPDQDKYNFIGFHFLKGDKEIDTYSYKVQYSDKGTFQYPFLDKLDLYGSSTGKLLGGYVDSSDFSKQWVERKSNNNPISLIDSVYFKLLSHEMTHYWGPDGLPEQLKESLVGNKWPNFHFEFYTGSLLAADINTRLKLVELPDDKYLKIFKIDCTSEPKHHDFDLYSMGLKSPEEIKEKLVVTNKSGQIPGYIRCGENIKVSEDSIRKSYSIQDFIDVLGPRIPSVVDSQKDFTIAFVLIVPKGIIPTQREIDAMNWIADKFPITWYKSTEGRSKLNEITPQDLSPPVISDVSVSATDSSIEVNWKTDERASSFVIYTEQASNSNSIIFPKGGYVTNPPIFSTLHQVIVESSGFTPINSDTLYKIKILSIDENYNLAIYDAGEVKTKDSKPSIISTVSGTLDIEFKLKSPFIIRDEIINEVDKPIYFKENLEIQKDLIKHGRFFMYLNFINLPEEGSKINIINIMRKDITVGKTVINVKSEKMIINDFYFQLKGLSLQEWIKSESISDDIDLVLFKDGSKIGELKINVFISDLEEENNNFVLKQLNAHDIVGEVKVNVNFEGMSVESEIITNNFFGTIKTEDGTSLNGLLHALVEDNDKKPIAYEQKFIDGKYENFYITGPLNADVYFAVSRLPFTGFHLKNFKKTIQSGTEPFNFDIIVYPNTQNNFKDEDKDGISDDKDKCHGSKTYFVDTSGCDCEQIGCSGDCIMKDSTPICSATCFDNIKNQNEEGIDCGGNCNPCPICSSFSLSNQCISDKKPYYCDQNGIAVKKCSVCSCPDEFECNEEDGQCYKTIELKPLKCKLNDFDMGCSELSLDSDELIQEKVSDYLNFKIKHVPQFIKKKIRNKINNEMNNFNVCIRTKEGCVSQDTECPGEDILRNKKEEITSIIQAEVDKKMGYSKFFLGILSFGIGKIEAKVDLSSFSLEVPSTLTCKPIKLDSDEACKKLIINGKSEDKADILFIGDKFSNDDELRKKILDMLDYEGNFIDTKFEGLFSREPFKSNKNKFNIWYMNTGKLDYEKEKKWGIVPKLEDVRIKEAICNNINYTLVLSNKDSYRSFCSGRTCFLSLPYKSYAGRLLLHEFGHGFANLADEYYNRIGEIDINSIVAPLILKSGIPSEYPNCKSTQQEAENAWGNLLEKSKNIGYFKGCGGDCDEVCANYIKPQKNSIMNDPNLKPFDPYYEVNERKILKELENYDASITTLSIIELESSTQCIKLNYAGDPKNKLDILFIGDNYLDSDKAKFANDVNIFINKLLEYEPFKSQKNKINFYRIDNTQDLVCKYNCRDIERLICCDNSKIEKVAVHCPHDQIFVIVNDDKYGGSGGTYSISYRGDPRVGIHEFGHSFGELSDEYSYGISCQNCDDINFDSIVNCDTESSCPKWLNLQNTNCVNGCTYNNWYRPREYNSMMLDLNGDFNPIGERQLFKLMEAYS